MEENKLKKLQDVDTLTQMVGAELLCYFPGKQCTKIPLTAAQMSLVADTLGLRLKDGFVQCYTDKKLMEIYFEGTKDDV